MRGNASHRETRHKSKYHLVETRIAKLQPYKYDVGQLSQYRGTSSRRLFLRPRRKGKVARGCAYQLFCPEECALEWKSAAKDIREKRRKTEIDRMKSKKRTGDHVESYDCVNGQGKRMYKKSCITDRFRMDKTKHETPPSPTLVSYTFSNTDCLILVQPQSMLAIIVTFII